MRLFLFSRAVACIVAASIFTNDSASGASGGPDAFGYTWVDFFEPSLSFFELSTLGRDEQILSFGDTATTVELERPFVLYGESYSSLVVSRFGYLATDLSDPGTDSTADCPLPATPDVGPDSPRIYAFHGDYSFIPPEFMVQSDVRYAYLPDVGHPTIPGGGHVFTWTNVLPPGQTNPLAFQVVLFDRFDILFQVGSATGTGPTFSTTTGIQQSGTASGITDSCGSVAPFEFLYSLQFRPPVFEVTTLEDELDTPVGDPTSPSGKPSAMLQREVRSTFPS